MSGTHHEATGPARLSFPEVTSEARPIADRMAARRGGELSALDKLLLHSPPVADGWNELLGALRHKSSLGADLRELAILRVAVLNNAAFEWVAHKDAARRAGITDAQIDALYDQDPRAHFDYRQNLVLELTDTATMEIEIPDLLFQQVRAEFSEREIVELMVTIGGYAMVSRFLVALRVPPPEGEVASV
ncbi:alkylhydroperoxidase AhpD family core domain-containing protein [Klenkia marina]|uniref:Alkylhydroperoxidase AhpD family core domain-containing protein n=1 Tax=Klenkia marina TaxID=1960309 RepID=A0A1G4X9E8_9ACTN|nr:carboxymuconolactone decarboxylase family protein [Klenkia marina]SCX37831.1 alkylhydroperoxidase AhpD family core domain-containing protein [Klenkia marina]